MPLFQANASVLGRKPLATSQQAAHINQALTTSTSADRQLWLAAFEIRTDCREPRDRVSAVCDLPQIGMMAVMPHAFVVNTAHRPPHDINASIASHLNASIASHLANIR
jgi:hypothetical protein